MKKMLTFLAVVAFAAASQAASFNWGGATANNMSPAGDDWVSAGTVYNLIYLGTAPAGTATTYYKDTGLTDLGGTLVDSYTYTQENWDNGDTGMGSYIADESAINGWYLAVVYDAATPDVFDSIAFEMSGLTNTGSAGDGMTPVANLGMNMGGTVTSSNIPEPTTAALLALGLAAFGLKRKVRA